MIGGIGGRLGVRRSALTGESSDSDSNQDQAQLSSSYNRNLMFFVFGVPRRGLRSSAYSFSSDSRYIDVLYYIFIYIYISINGKRRSYQESPSCMIGRVIVLKVQNPQILTPVDRC